MARHITYAFIHYAIYGLLIITGAAVRHNVEIPEGENIVQKLYRVIRETSTGLKTSGARSSSSGVTPDLTQAGGTILNTPSARANAPWPQTTAIREMTTMVIYLTPATPVQRSAPNPTTPSAPHPTPTFPSRAPLTTLSTSQDRKSTSKFSSKSTSKLLSSKATSKVTTASRTDYTVRTVKTTTVKTTVYITPVSPAKPPLLQNPTTPVSHTTPPMPTTPATRPTFNTTEVGDIADTRQEPDESLTTAEYNTWGIDDNIIVLRTNDELPETTTSDSSRLLMLNLIPGVDGKYEIVIIAVICGVILTIFAGIVAFFTHHKRRTANDKSKSVATLVGSTSGTSPQTSKKLGARNQARVLRNLI